ncbi:hypothetical protein BDF14DRAFT_1998537 [Spinellus fusiger]|nr:hypothetical protein BDF14DRAFT_1998537 [Spinellus fusiger]
MAFRLLTKSAAVAATRTSIIARPAARAVAVRGFTSQKESEQKPNSILDTLPGQSLASKAAYLTVGGGASTFLISQEIYILNEETLVLVASLGLLGVLLKYLREPFTTMANDHINRIKNVLVQAREDHKSAVKERIDEVGQMKDLVDVTKSLFELSRETVQLEAETFRLKQQVAVAHEVKATLDSWVRHEANVRDREQKQLATYLMNKIQKDLQDPNVQQQILNQAILDVEKLAKSA